MNITTIIDEGDVLFRERLKELKDQNPKHLRESEPVYFGYSVDRDDEIFRVVDFGNIKSHIHSRELALLKGVWEEAEGMKIHEKCNPLHVKTSGVLGICHNCSHLMGWNSSLSALQAKIQEAIIHLEKKV